MSYFAFDSLNDQIEYLYFQVFVLYFEVEIDNSSFSSKVKLENAKNKYIPFIVVLDKEKIKGNNIIVYTNNQTKDYNIEDFIEEVKKCQKF